MPRRPQRDRDEEQIRVLILDDQVAFSDGLANWLEDDGFRVETIAAIDGLDLAVKSLAPDVVLIDLQLPSHDEGLAVPVLVRALAPEARCLALTGVKEPMLAEFVPKALSAAHAQAGSVFDGFLTKSMHAADIADAVREAVRQGGYILPSVIQYMKEQPLELSAEQSRLLELYAQGKTYREIAIELSVSERTAKRRGSAIRSLFDVDKTSQALAAAIEQKKIRKSPRETGPSGP